MNVREISKQELPFTLETLEKIFKEHGADSSILKDISPNCAADILPEKNFRFFSAFENGGEIGSIGLKDNHICILAIKKYAQRRGVGTQLVKSVLSSYPKGTRITVNAENPSVPFYSQLGFTPDYNTKTIIDESQIDYTPMFIVL